MSPSVCSRAVPGVITVIALYDQTGDGFSDAPPHYR